MNPIPAPEVSTMSSLLAPGIRRALAPAPLGALCALCAFGLVILAAPVLARDFVPTPPGGGPGVTILPADQANPTDLRAPDPRQYDPLRNLPERLDGVRLDDLGGDDVTISTHVAAYEDDLAIASNGDLYSIVMWDNDDNSYRFSIRRSQDGGTTWSLWATFYDPTPGYRYWGPGIHIAEGLVDRCFVNYSLDPDDGGPTELHVAWSPLDLATGDFSQDTVIATTSEWIFDSSLATDAASFDEYFVYLAYSEGGMYGNDIHFVRSVDQGTSWESPYEIGTIGVSDRGYYAPHVTVGYGGYVHVVWFLGFPDDHEYDDTLRYRRASNYAGGGLASWGNLRSLTSHTNGVSEYTCDIAASLETTSVLIACQRRERQPDDTWIYAGLGTLSSGDSGTTWSAVTVIGAGLDWLGDLLCQESTGRWILGATDWLDWGYRWAPVASPASWSDLLAFNDTYSSSGPPALVLDPTHDDRVGLAGGRTHLDSYSFLFDAEWRADPGYPNLEDGFPVDLAAEPESDPAVVDLDGDGYLEIVFGDDAGRVQVYRHDGSPQSGWPVDTGAALSPSPIAIGDLNGDGRLTVVAGTNDGRVFAYHADGTLLAGWPFTASVTAPAYIAIGAVGGPYPRAVVVATGNRVSYIDWHGERYPGCVDRVLGSGTVTSAPAVGDIDGDGRSETVIAASQGVYAFQMDDAAWDLDLDLEADVSGGITLGDFDLDGDVEIVAPLASGALHLLDGDGTEFPGAWPVSLASTLLDGAAIAQCLGTAEPEIAVTERYFETTVLWYDGAIGVGWPVDTGGWYIYGKPIIGRVDGTSSDVVVGARGRHGWAWDNLGNLIDGWPKTIADHIYQTPAYGDLDLDGRAEIVLLSTGQLLVVDVNNTLPDATRIWAMAGHDPERSGCADCAVDLVAVEEEGSGVTRVSFAAPWPNPIAGEAAFAYAVPVRARVDLAIYDVRGRRVATVQRAEQEAGRHVIAWHGRDDRGRPVASGQYVATLRVQGPGLDETVNRKVTVLR
ncbi:MAG: FG-GAP-like repeat-containing protein [Candidatus Krumholzibacteria bacterium]|nr:FG-GAP-like repeat-containing protein [Candidatus Krumholzibacteria bacterium]